ncbi:MAG TPA: GTPase Era [Bdellovibrionales bacterium]|nr:GTPase Era [Bdellovibrionales bacterium]
MFRSGFIALVGMPNSGKSTLLNALVGEKVAIVSPKPQTTRRRVQGIVTTPEAQLILVDAPGVLESTSSELNKFLIQEYQDVLSEADGALAIIPADEKSLERTEKILDLVKRSKKPFLLVVNKADLLSEAERAELAERLKQLPQLAELKEKDIPILFTSALHAANEARSSIVSLAASLLPESPALYDQELFTTETLRDMAAEIVREKCFFNLHQEIPFGLAVKITAFNEEPKMTRIEADILVERESHKKIVIGEKANQLKRIGTEARKELEKVLGTKVFLGLHVVCKPRWMQDKALLKELGYVKRD